MLFNGRDSLSLWTGSWRGFMLLSWLTSLPRRLSLHSKVTIKHFGLVWCIFGMIFSNLYLNERIIIVHDGHGVAIWRKLGFSSGIRELIDAQIYGSFHLCKVKISGLKSFAVLSGEVPMLTKGKQHVEIFCFQKSQWNNAHRIIFIFWQLLQCGTNSQNLTPYSHWLPHSTTILFCMRAATAELLSSW